MSSLHTVVNSRLWKTVSWTNPNIKFEFADVYPLKELVSLFLFDFTLVWNEILESYPHKNIYVVHAYLSLTAKDEVTFYKDNLLIDEQSTLKNADEILQYFVNKSIPCNCIETDYIMIQLLNK